MSQTPRGSVRVSGLVSVKFDWLAEPRELQVGFRGTCVFVPATYWDDAEQHFDLEDIDYKIPDYVESAVIFGEIIREATLDHLGGVDLLNYIDP